MNLSAAIMLVRPDAVRPVRVEYDPDNKYNNSPMKVFKTVDPSITVGDLVIVQTHTRHGFTIAKVTAVDFAVDYNDGQEWGWIGGKFDHEAFKSIIAIEDGVKNKVAKANENKMRQEIIAAMGLGEVSFNDLQLRRLAAASPDGVDTEAAVVEAPPSYKPAPSHVDDIEF